MQFKSRYWIVSIFAAAAVSIAVAGLSGPKTTSTHGVAWFDSLEDAKTQAKRTGKPILLLSMFGHLDEKMPCANARTLRATLFKDPAFKKFAEEEAVLAWEMVREVPKITIDFGDGKKLERTARGNAVMYLCNADGNVMDAYPGIYTADDFFPMVRQAIKELNGKSDEEIAAWHDARAKLPRTILSTLGKSAAESPTLDLMSEPTFVPATVKSPVTGNDPKKLRFLLAAQRVRDLSLTPMSSDRVAMSTTGQPIGDRSPEDVGQEILARDSQLNVTQMRLVMHCWLASMRQLPSVSSAREDVLETVLKIPYKDPYFGLNEIAIPGTPVK